MLGFQYTKKDLPCINRLISTSMVIMCLAASASYSSTNWPNEPAGSTVISDCPFNGSICPTMFNSYKSGYFIVDPTAPTGGDNKVLDDYMPAGTSVGSGSGVWGASFSPNAREVYTGAWWKTNADFEGSQNNGNKLWYVGGAPGNNSIFMWTGPQGLGTPRTIHFQFQTVEDNCHILGDCSTPWSGALAANVNAAAATVKPGSGWHQLELYQKASTTSISRDGIVRWWVDGVLCGNYTTLNYSPGGFDNVQINHAWDGTHVRNQSLEWHHYWDQMRVSIPNGAPIPVLALAITSPLQTSAQVSKPYSATLAAENGKAPYGWTVSAGSLPPGFTLNKTTGVLSGTPTTMGRSDFTVKVMDSSVPAAEATKAFSIIVSRPTGIGGEQLTVNSSQLMAASRMGSVRFNLPQPGVYALSVYDLAGKKVYEHKAGTRGQKEMRIEAALKNGIYFAKLSQGREMSTVRFSVMN